VALVAHPRAERARRLISHRLPDAVNGICLLVAGALRATLPGSDFTLAWDHSVEKVEWRERYVVASGALRLVEARVAGSGAGMEAPPGATFADGAWTWAPDRPALPELRLTYSRFTGDYRLCGATRCATLGELAAPLTDGDVVTVRACD
jgi:hypothetical protein